MASLVVKRYSPSNDNRVPSSRDRRRKTGGGQTLGTLVTRLAVATATTIITASRMLPRPQEVVLRWEHRVVQIILQIVRRRRQVSRDLGGASHWPRYRDYRRRRTARRCFWQCLRCSQGCRTRIVPATRSSCREKKGKGEFHQQGKDLIIFLFTTQTKFYKFVSKSKRRHKCSYASSRTLRHLGTLPARLWSIGIYDRIDAITLKCTICMVRIRI